MDKLISLLIPTRRRPKQLLKCINSFVAQAADPTSIEVLVRVDDDDAETLLLDIPQHVHIITGPRPANGYGGLHLLYNELYCKATGRYIWVLNDDTEIQTPLWDNHLRALNDKPCIGKPKCSAGIGNTFPIIHRSIPDAQGFFALYASLDVQYERLASTIPELHLQLDELYVQHGCEQRQHDIDNLPHVPVEGDPITAAEFVRGIHRIRESINLG